MARVLEPLLPPGVMLEPRQAEAEVWLPPWAPLLREQELPLLPEPQALQRGRRTAQES
jgi:hypothetical protein